MAKKKVTGTGHFGSRYGKKIREDIKKAIRTKIKKYICPACSRRAVKRESAGVWKCSKCKTKFASGAYKFTYKDVVKKNK